MSGCPCWCHNTSTSNQTSTSIDGCSVSLDALLILLHIMYHYILWPITFIAPLRSSKTCIHRYSSTSNDKSHLTSAIFNEPLHLYVTTSTEQLPHPQQHVQQFIDIRLPVTYKETLHPSIVVMSRFLFLVMPFHLTRRYIHRTNASTQQRHSYLTQHTQQAITTNETLHSSLDVISRWMSLVVTLHPSEFVSNKPLHKSCRYIQRATAFIPRTTHQMNTNTQRNTRHYTYQWM